MKLDDIIEAVKSRRTRMTLHAESEAKADGITLDDLYYSVEYGEILSEYPEDRPYPSCLIYGRDPNGQPLHSVWAYNETTRSVVAVTVYRPDPDLWIDFRVRKKQP